MPKRTLDKRLEPFMQHLRDVLYERRLSLAEVERRIPLPSKYLSKLLGGSVEMKLVHLYDVLAAAEVEPREFFSRLCGETPSVDLGEVIRRLSTLEEKGRQ